MTKTTECPKCGAQIPADISVDNEGVAVVHYDPKTITKIVLVNSESESRQDIALSGGQSPKPKPRHMAGIIGPY